jgi:hypothetical protein
VGDERGAALIIVLITLIGITALAAAGMMISETDVRASQNIEASANAFYAADAGLQEYMGTNTFGTPTDTFAYTAGSTIVTGEKLLDLPNDRILYRIESASSYTPPEGGTAERLVSRLALFSTGDMLATAAIASGTGLLKNGAVGTLSGFDTAPSGDPNCPNSPAPDVAGVSVPTGGYTQNGGGQLVPEGNPAVEEVGTGIETLEQTGVPWDAIVNGGLLAPDYTLPADSWPASFPSGDWPVIYATGDLTVDANDDGRGILIVRGDLDMNGSFEWDGIMLVGGALTSDGYQVIEGTTVTGLNILLGETVADSDIGNGNKVFQYHSCYVTMARQAAFGGLSEVPGSWTEDWN